MKINECPRCDGNDIETIGKSPKEGAWELYCCNKCQYIWRSTETIDMLTTMKLKDEEILAIPAVPPLGSKE